ncbi:MAG: DUF4272 domain-containing protein [Planctomycetaceae bacterium]|nr:DUF4272 domain-containing protein [Planctomycetaceae bacterium]
MRPAKEDVVTRLRILGYLVRHSFSTPPEDVLKELFSRWSGDDCHQFDESCRQRAQETISEMKSGDIWKAASPREKKFLESFGSRIESYERLAASWRMECAGIMMWALNWHDWPKIDEELSPDIFKNIPQDKPPQLMEQAEVDKKRDLIELWHWRVRTRQLIEEGQRLPADEKLRAAGFHTFDDIVRFTAKQAHENGDLSEIKEDDFLFLGKPFRALPQEEYFIARSIISERHYALNWLCGRAPGNRWDETPTET